MGPSRSDVVVRQHQGCNDMSLMNHRLDSVIEGAVNSKESVQKETSGVG